MNFNELKLKEISKLLEIFDYYNKSSSKNEPNNPGLNSLKNEPNNPGLNSLLGEKVIIRTYNAGVHYGELIEKYENEVILKNSRRLAYWVTKNKGISLSEISNHGVSDDSKICEEVPLLWLEAIEIIKCSDEAIESIESKNAYITS